MEGNDRRSLRLEVIRLGWDYTSKEIEIHKSRYLQLFAVFLSIALTALASVLVERIPPSLGLAFAAAMFLATAYAHFRLLRLPHLLRRSLDAAIVGIDRLMREEKR